MLVARIRLLCLLATVGVIVWLITGSSQPPSANSDPPAPPSRALAVRIGVETLRNPYWYAEHGYSQEEKQFWDRDHWDRILRGWADEGYTYVLYWVEPWNRHAWQTFTYHRRAHRVVNEAAIGRGQLRCLRAATTGSQSHRHQASDQQTVRAREHIVPLIAGSRTRWASR